MHPPYCFFFLFYIISYNQALFKKHPYSAPKIMSITPKDIFNTINKIRQNPNIVLNQIKQQLKKFESNSVYRNKQDIKIRTLSGKAGWQETVLAIQRQKSKGNLLWNSLLEHCLEQYKKISQEDPSINPFPLIKQYCTYQGNISFNINQSDVEQDVVQVVAAMVVGDGDEKKGSRTAIFHPLYRDFACAVRRTGNKLVVFTVFAQSVQENTGGMSSPSKNEGLNNKSQSESRSSWEDVPTGKFQQPEQSSYGGGGFGAKSSHSNNNPGSNYKKQQSPQDTKQSYIKKGKQLIAQLNKIRKEPKQYVHALKAELQKFKDDKIINTDYGIVTTKEGQGPYYDLISELETQYPLPTMREVSGLTLVALQQIIQTESMIESKVKVEQIIDKFCSASQGIRSIKLRDIEGMPISAMLMRLLVGDGDRKRTARRKMLSPICKAIGCAVSRDVLVVNVGETAKDNGLAVEEYMGNLEAEVGSGMGKKSKAQSFGKYQPSQVDNPYFDKASSVSDSASYKNRQNEGQRVIIKKTSKSHNESKAGRIYRITEIQIIYNDGQIQRQIEEELLN